MLNFNFYKIYQYNIWYIINYFKLNYYWLNISDYSFKNGANNVPFKDFLRFNNPWLEKYNNKKTDLAKDILEHGTFTPIFYQQIKNEKYIILGKHRIFSLKSYEYLFHKKINKKFLFIEIPQNFINNLEKELYFFAYENPMPIKKLINNYQLFDLIGKTGDALTPYLWENNCVPFEPFNDEKLFEEWLNTPIEELYGDIDI